MMDPVVVDVGLVFKTGALVDVGVVVLRFSEGVLVSLLLVVILVVSWVVLV